MKKKLTLHAIFCLLVWTLSFGSLPAHAQFLGYESPQGVQGVVMNRVTSATVTPTGSGAANCPVSTGNSCSLPQLGQNVHYLTYTTTSSGSMTLDIRLEGSIDGTTFFPVSADATTPGGGALCAIGYYPVLRANLVSLSGVSATVTANYAGTSGTSGCPLGTFNPAQDRSRAAFVNFSGTSSAPNVTTPFANAYGEVVARCTSISGGSSTLTIDTVDQVNATQAVGLLTISSCAGPFVLPLPPFPTSSLQFALTGAATITGLNVYVIFFPPPIDRGYNSTLITTNAQTEIKNTGGGAGGLLAAIIVNSIGSSDATATIFDGLIGGGVCSGTNKGTLNIGSAIGTVAYQIQFFTGLCITTAGTTPANLTVAWR